jgi:hypothetical protein
LINNSDIAILRGHMKRRTSAVGFGLYICTYIEESRNHFRVAVQRSLVQWSVSTLASGLDVTICLVQRFRDF